MHGFDTDGPLRQSCLKLVLMGSSMSWSFVWLILTFFCAFVQRSDEVASDSLDAFVQECALRTLVHHRPHTGPLYKAILPANLSGMEVSVVQLRSRQLWSRGANFSHFHIPSRTMPVPHVKRLVLVYQDLGNWSSYYYPLPGFTLLSSVVGLIAYDASNLEENRTVQLNLNTMGKPISVNFGKLSSFSRGRMSEARCAALSASGTVYLSDMSLPSVCYGREQGHFSIVVPVKRKQKWKSSWVGGFAVGFMGLVVMTSVGMVVIRLSRKKKIAEMEKQADESVVLGMIWIGGSKMPSATVTRTQPVLENGAAL